MSGCDDPRGFARQTDSHVETNLHFGFGFAALQEHGLHRHRDVERLRTRYDRRKRTSYFDSGHNLAYKNEKQLNV